MDILILEDDKATLALIAEELHFAAGFDPVWPVLSIQEKLHSPNAHAELERAFIRQCYDFQAPAHITHPDGHRVTLTARLHLAGRAIGDQKFSAGFFDHRLPDGESADHVCAFLQEQPEAQLFIMSSDLHSQERDIKQSGARWKINADAITARIKPIRKLAYDVGREVARLIQDIR